MALTTALPPRLNALLQYCIVMLLIATAAGSAAIMSIASRGTETKTGPGLYCIVIMENSKIMKDIGSIWVNAANPCAVHTCEIDEKGHVKETITSENCDQYYCDVDSELRPQNGTCCGTCVRTKCRSNDTVYDIGQTWHNADDCTLMECVELPNGQPMINVFQKSCPPHPPDCAPDNIYVADCCHYCRSARAETDMSEHEDLWTEEFYKKHPCVRDCKPNTPPQTCRYTFVVEWYETLSKACFGCPHNTTDCSRPHCIVGDGLPRSVTVVNRMMPGPTIEVCENDMIMVDVKNHLLGESTTIHWHGMHHRHAPYMDGVPHISQCPISPHATFRYTFRAENPGTHFWHSHTGMQRGDGVFGALIVKRPKSLDPHGQLYDFDLPEHKMMVQDWVHLPGVSMFSSHHHSRGDNKPRQLLINGKGRFYKLIWEEAVANGRLTTTTTPAEISSDAPTTALPQDDIIDFEVIQDVPTNGRMAMPDKPALKANEVVAPTNTTQYRTKRFASEGYEIPLEKVPLQIYTVRQNSRYRFRIINAEFLNCPIAVSIDKHSLLAINSDGYDFEPVDVGSIVTYAGERFDFVLNASQPVGNYWIRLKGLMDCSEKFTSAFQVAILRYEGAPDEEPPGELGYDYKVEGIELNALNRGSGHVGSLTVAELSALPQYDNVPGLDQDALKPVADYKFFTYYDFYAKDNPVFHPSDLYGFDSIENSSSRLFTPQLNHISLKFPSQPLLPARFEMSDAMFCNETSLAQKGIDCRKEFCQCHHVLQVPLNAIVEFIIVDEGFTFDANHPFHLHGNAFRVVAMERLGANVTIEMVKELDRLNKLKRNLVRPPIKDTVTIPDGGYTIVRFEAYNPGFWLFHCHIEFHAEIGMALVLKVGDNNEMPPVPKDFPKCNDYMPDGKEDNSQSTTTESPEGGKNLAGWSRLHGFSIRLFALLAIVRVFLESS